MDASTFHHERADVDEYESAVCDVSETQRARGVKLVNDHYKDQACAAHGDFRELLQRKDLDAVLIATHDPQHAQMAIDSLEAGKHVYVAKPLAVDVPGCQSIGCLALNIG